MSICSEFYLLDVGIMFVSHCEMNLLTAGVCFRSDPADLVAKSTCLPQSKPLSHQNETQLGTRGLAPFFWGPCCLHVEGFHNHMLV